MSTTPIVAVVPFGARGPSPRAGVWARQLARRLVDRFSRETAFELRPMFLVAMPEAGAGAPGSDAPGDAAYLIFGSSPEPDLAGEYAASLGATHALTATYREGKDGRALDAALVDATSRAVVDARSFAIEADALQRVETDISAWLATALSVTPTTDLLRPAAASEAAYAALLEAMDEEVNATLLRPSDPARAAASVRAASARYLDAVRADPEGAAAEERLLVLAAESLERGDLADEVRALEDLITLRPRSWRANYILGQLRAEAGDANGAIVAFEHAHSLRSLAATDLVRLAELYANAGAPAPALAHLRRIAPGSPAYGAAQELLAIIMFQRGGAVAGRAAFANAVSAGTTSWELHASYGAALHAGGELAEAATRYRDALALKAPAVVRINLARVLLAGGDRAETLRQLDTVIAEERSGEILGQAHRLRFGLQAPALERDLERAGQAALAGDATTLDASQGTFQRALAIDPELWEAHFGLGIVARQRGDASAAQGSFRRVLELWPDQPDALHELGVALLMGNEGDAALAALDHAASLRPDDPAYIADAGFAHLRAGDLVRARQRLERATSLDANDPITKAYLGELARVEAAAGKRS